MRVLLKSAGVTLVAFVVAGSCWRGVVYRGFPRPPFLMKSLFGILGDGEAAYDAMFWDCFFTALIVCIVWIGSGGILQRAFGARGRDMV